MTSDIETSGPAVDPDAVLRAAQAWAAWFAAEAADARQWSQHFEYEAQQATEVINRMIEQGVEAGLGLKSLTVEHGEATLSIATAGVAEATVLTMLDGLADMLGDATNYVEFDLRRRGKSPVSVCVRRMYRPTPHELRERAERERDAAKAEAAQLRAELAALDAEACARPPRRERNG